MNRIKIFITAMVLLTLSVVYPAAQQSSLGWRAPLSDNDITVRLAQRDSLISIFTWVFDDGIQAMWDSSTVFDTYNQPVSIAIISKFQTNGANQDTTTYISADKVRALEARGWEIVNHGWSHHMDDFGSDSGAVATGKFEGITSFQDDIVNGFLALRDTIGVAAPRAYSCPYNGTWPNTMRILSQYHDCALAPYTHTSTGGNASASYRQCTDYPIYAAYKTALTAYPGVFQGPYELAQVLNDNPNIPSFAGSVWREFRAGVLKGVALRGSWVMYVGHSPVALATNTGQSVATICAFIDSLQTAGKLRVMNMSAAYDLACRTPIGPGANWIYENFDDTDSDGVVDGVDIDAAKRRWDVTVYADSVYADSTGGNAHTGTANFGHGGYGYATLDWDVGGTRSDHFNNTPAARSWFGREAEYIMRKPSGSGWLIKFDVFAQVDPAIDKPNATFHTTNSESLGVCFYGYYERMWNRWGSDKDLVYGDATRIQHSEWMSNRYNGFPAPGNFALFEPGDTVGGTWKHLIGTWRVPDDVDWVYVDIWKDSGLLSEAVRISNPNISWIKQDYNDRW